MNWILTPRTDVFIYIEPGDVQNCYYGSKWYLEYKPKREGDDNTRRNVYYISSFFL